jgi:hypothetical protein
MASLTQSSLLKNKQCNSAPPILTSGTLPTLSLDDIHDILSIIKSTTTRLAPQNAHWCLGSIHQGLDFASTKIDKFQDDLRVVSLGAGLDGNLAHTFFDVSDAVLDVVRAVEQAPIAIAYAAKIKHPLKETWGYLKSFGPLPCERQQKLRKIYCSILKVVIKVQVGPDTLTPFITHIVFIITLIFTLVPPFSSPATSWDSTSTISQNTTLIPTFRVLTKASPLPSDLQT